MENNIKRFYNLFFQFELEKDNIGKPIFAGFNLGFYSTKRKAKEKIDAYKLLPGFINFSIKYFKIKSYKVDISLAKKEDENYVLHELTHQYFNDKRKCDVNSHLGLFPTESACQEKIQTLIKTKKYCNYPESFLVDKYVVNVHNEWLDGFRVESD